MCQLVWRAGGEKRKYLEKQQKKTKKQKNENPFETK